MSDLVKYHKVVSALPGTLDANSVYYVRVGSGVDMYVTNDIGVITAYQLNPPVMTIAGTAVTTNVTLTNNEFDHVISVTGSSSVTITIDPVAVINGFRATIIRRGTGSVEIAAGSGTISTLSASSSAQRLMENGTVRLTEDGTPRLMDVSETLSLEQNETAVVMVPANDVVFVEFPDRGELLRAYVDAELAALSTMFEPLIPTGTTDQFISGGKTLVNLPAAVRSVPATGLSTLDATEVSETDTLLAAIGKLQAQISASGGGGDSTQIGDMLITARDPGANYLQANGAIYLQSTYPELYAEVGLVGGAVGTSWSLVTSGVANNFRGVDVGGNTWIACAASGVIRRSTDRGVTWAGVTSGTAVALGGIATDKNGVWVVVGAGGTILRSTDDGITWNPVTSGTANELSAIATDRFGVWVAVGVNGSTSVRSTNNGLTWSVFAIGVTTAMNCISTDGNGAWVAAGASGVVRRSGDNGSAWEARTTPAGTAATFYSIDNNAGVWIIVSSNGAYTERSEDNGFTWAHSTLGVAADFHAIVTDGTGVWVALGAASYARRSVNGGMTWSVLSIPTNQTLYQAIFDDDGVIVSVANAGVIIRSTPQFNYDPGTQFKVPNQAAVSGIKAYIKANNA